ncbi:hypothetical protein BpHYR1_041252 [Brachionus plicatilis]|uniref:Uncharacterized protein n=1 Tax=Brachionus plicatilis TaxID=10195 RepID=A0A3M7PYB9_BRAPC|nr:hypothetical protein BpHYR1_041252 [Brachionus plicatilis]
MFLHLDKVFGHHIYRLFGHRIHHDSRANKCTLDFQENMLSCSGTEDITCVEMVVGSVEVCEVGIVVVAGVVVKVVECIFSGMVDSAETLVVIEDVVVFMKF